MRKLLAGLALIGSIASVATITADPAAASGRHQCGVRIVGQPQPPACVAGVAADGRKVCHVHGVGAVPPCAQVGPADWWWGKRPVNNAPTPVAPR